MKFPGPKLNWKFTSRNAKERLLVAIGIAVLSFTLVIAVRHGGGLERIELPIHDRIVGFLAGVPSHPDVVVILETEADLQRFGHPLTDEKLVQLLQALDAMKPALLAVDKYRDLPVPPGSAALDKLLSDTPNIFWVAKYGVAAFDGVRAPKILEGSDRVACADIVVDTDLRVRRSLIAVGESDRVCPGIAYALAAAWLHGKGIGIGFDEARNHALTLGNTTMPATRPWDGPYAGEDTSGYQVPVSYLRAPPPSYTLSQLADGQVPPSAIQGRIVLFGSSATSLRDFFEVPHRARELPTNLPGVTVHAYALIELLDAASGRQPLVVVGAVVTGIAAAAMALIGAFIFVTMLPIATMSLIAALIVIAWLPAAALLAASGVVIAPTAPMLAGLIAATTSAGFRAWREARDRQELMGWFSKHVSREVAEAIWHGREEFTAGGQIPPRSVHVTVLFADIRSYTTITEQLPIPVMVAWLNRAISAMCAAVMEYEGVVTRFAGDQVMAVFGVPIPRKDERDISADAEHAIDAGLAMGANLSTLNADFTREGLPSARVRVGIYSGGVVQAGLGSADRFEFTVLGDVVNIASRLESYTTEDDGSAARVLIGGPTRDLVPGRFEIAPLGELELKGKKTMISVFRVFDRIRNKETS